MNNNFQALREAKTAESERTMELEEARGRVDQLEKVLRTKDSILQRTKDERDEINIRNEVCYFIYKLNTKYK